MLIDSSLRLLEITTDLPTEEVNFTGTVTANSFLPSLSLIFINRNNTLAKMSIIRVPSQSIITNILAPTYGAQSLRENLGKVLPNLMSSITIS